MKKKVLKYVIVIFVCVLYVGAFAVALSKDTFALMNKGKPIALSAYSTELYHSDRSLVAMCEEDNLSNTITVLQKKDSDYYISSFDWKVNQVAKFDKKVVISESYTSLELFDMTAGRISEGKTDKEYYVYGNAIKDNHNYGIVIAFDKDGAQLRTNTIADFEITFLSSIPYDNVNYRGLSICGKKNNNPYLGNYDLLMVERWHYQADMAGKSFLSFVSSGRNQVSNRNDMRYILKSGTIEINSSNQKEYCSDKLIGLSTAYGLVDTIDYSERTRWNNAVDLTDQPFLYAPVMTSINNDQVSFIEYKSFQLGLWPDDTNSFPASEPNYSASSREIVYRDLFKLKDNQILYSTDKKIYLPTTNNPYQIMVQESNLSLVPLAVSYRSNVNEPYAVFTGLNSSFSSGPSLRYKIAMSQAEFDKPFYAFYFAASFRFIVVTSSTIYIEASNI